MSLAVAGPTSGVFFAGNDRSLEFTVTVDGAPVDITGMILRFVMARRPGAAPVLSSEGSAATVVCSIVTAASGIWKAVIAAEDTEDLFGTYQYQAQVEDGSGAKSNVLFGYFTFKPNLIA
jgi:hypothetical protein